MDRGALLDPLGCRWDREGQVLTTPRGPVRLSVREGALFERLLAAEGDVVERADLEPGGGAGRTADFAVRRLREKIEQDPGDPRILLTVHGRGYRLGLPRAPVVAPHAPANLLVLGDREVDLDLGLVKHLGDEVLLSGLQREVLVALVDAGGRVVDRDDLRARAWGTHGGSRAVDALIHQLRELLEPRPAEPVFLLTVRGRGYVLRRELPKTNLGPSRPLLGRAAELAAVVDAIGAHGCVVVTGPPGVGKTLLCEHACREASTRLPGGAWWVEAAQHRSVEGLLRAIGAALGFGEPPATPKGLTAALARREGLGLCLDNVEQIAGVEELVAELVRAGVWVLASSTRRLSVRAKVVPLGGLSPADARAMYLAIAGESGEAASTDGLDAWLSEVEGLPLAIELAARRAGTLTPRSLRSLELVDEGATEPRHASLRAALDWVWGLAGPGERRAWVATALFRGPFSAEAVERIAVGGSLGSLVDRSLVARVPGSDPPLYRLSHVVAEYLAPRARSDAELVARYHAWVVEAAVRIHQATNELAGRAELARALPDLVAVGAELAADQPQQAAQVLLVLFQIPTAHAAAAALARALTDRPDRYPGLADAWLARAMIEIRAADLPAASTSVATAERLSPTGWWLREAKLFLAQHRGQPPDPGPEAPELPLDRIRWMSWRGRHLCATGELGEGMALLRTGARLARRSGLVSLAIGLEVAEAGAAFEAGVSASRTAERFSSAMSELEALGSPLEAGWCAWRAAQVLLARGRLAQARLLAERALGSAEALDAPVLEIRARSVSLGADVEGNPVEVLTRAVELGALARSVNDGTGVAFAAYVEAVARARMGELAAVLALADRADLRDSWTGPALAALAAVLDPARALPEPPSRVRWPRSVVLAIHHRRWGTPLHDRRVVAELSSNPLVRVIEAIRPRATVTELRPRRIGAPSAR
ncbi:MAG: winged helix-turn-helix domain-containing protein [Myxococcota bacterium]